jgi:hypothetical protein
MIKRYVLLDIAVAKDNALTILTLQHLGDDPATLNLANNMSSTTLHENTELAVAKPPRLNLSDLALIDATRQRFEACGGELGAIFAERNAWLRDQRRLHYSQPI